MRVLHDYQWAGYCGDGNHDKLWAICITENHCVVIRYGSAKHPRRLRMEMFPKASRADAIEDYRRRLLPKSTRSRERYEQIAFGSAPHFLEDFNTYFTEQEDLNRYFKEQDEKATIDSMSPQASSPLPPTLQECLVELATLACESCPRCGTSHVSHFIDLGEGHIVSPQSLLEDLTQTPDGRRWLETPCVHQEGTLFHPATTLFLGRVINVLSPPQTGGPDIALDLIPCLALLRQRKEKMD